MRRGDWSTACDVDHRERICDHIGIHRTHQPAFFCSIMQEDQRRPQLYPEGAPQRATSAVGNLDVMHARMLFEGDSDQRLRGATMPAPWAAEFNHDRFFSGINFGAAGFHVSVVFIHHHIMSATRNSPQTAILPTMRGHIVGAAKFRILFVLPLFVAGLYDAFTEAAATSSQKYPNLVSAKIRGRGEEKFDFDVTISSLYDSPQRYADAFHILGNWGRRNQ